MLPIYVEWLLPWYHDLLCFSVSVIIISLWTTSFAEQINLQRSRLQQVAIKYAMTELLWIINIRVATDLPMRVYNTAEQLPRATSSIHSHHTKDLEESKSTQGRKYLARCSHRNYHYRCTNCDDIWKGARRKNGDISSFASSYSPRLEICEMYRRKTDYPYNQAIHDEDIIIPRGFFRTKNGWVFDNLFWRSNVIPGRIDTDLLCRMGVWRISTAPRRLDTVSDILMTIIWNENRYNIQTKYILRSLFSLKCCRM